MTEMNQTEDGRTATPTASQGMEASANDADEFARLLKAAIDYRGDVTLYPASDEPIVGYVFDVDARSSPPVVRLLPADGGARIAVPLTQLSKVEITGKDTAAGRSFETWVKKYVERKRAGRSANIEGDTVDERETHDA
jgi:hypothetical protein